MIDPALTLLATIIARLPRGVRESLGGALGYIAGSILRIRRRLVESAMGRAGVRDPATVSARMYCELGQGLCELLWLAAATPERREQTVADVKLDPEAVRALEDAARHGPVVLFASHTGNWELAAAAAARLLMNQGRRLAIVAKAMSARGVDVFLTRLRARLGVRVVPPQGAFGAARTLLDAGDVVAMPIDQVPERVEHGVRVSFLEEIAFADRAPATLAWRSRATVLVVAARRVGQEQHVTLLATIPPPRPEQPSRVWIEDTTRAATSALDGFVRSTPESWLWLHRRWRAPRQSAARQSLVATGEPG